jgi:hypothetical protein
VTVALRAKHASTPFEIDEKGQADGPEQDEAQHQERNPRRLAEVVYFFDQAHEGAPFADVNDVNVNDIYIGVADPGSQGPGENFQREEGKPNPCI